METPEVSLQFFLLASGLFVVFGFAVEFGRKHGILSGSGVSRMPLEICGLWVVHFITGWGGHDE